ncbi:restriction endonuclease subunit S [Acinetobacter baumannii]|nr:restriction endonuclease subunit S [Acinetobacter baumannii]MDC5428084.1 restriction endonuclease subunit S [Acinetobacter baumannii]MDO7484325.1 restriction endonuclease subunit S [Acinetobacter baumannii]
MTTPKLRFKEFDGCWVEKIISEIADVRGGKRLPKGYSLQEENNGFPYITVTDMENGTVNLEKIRYVPLEAIDQIKRYRISVDEIYISVAGTLGLVGIIPQELNNANLTENADKLTNIKCNQFYLLHYLNNGSLSKLIDSVSTIGAQPKLALYAIQGMPIFLPSLDEQTKIASFLSAVDEKINQLTQKHQLLSQYKQGMMQKLFSQQLRFKADDGGEFAKWEDSKLGELTTLITKGTTPSSLGEKYEESGINFIKIESLSSNGKFLLDKFAYIDENTHNKLARSKLEHDDILFSIAGVLGRVAIISRDYLPANTNQALAIIRLKDKKITRYIYYFLNSDYVKKIIDAESVQLAQANFSLGQLANLDVLVPCLEEQTKIANFLSAIDQKIEVVAQQIEQAKQWKKGLLQQMFI